MKEEIMYTDPLPIIKTIVRRYCEARPDLRRYDFPTFQHYINIHIQEFCYRERIDLFYYPISEELNNFLRSYHTSYHLSSNSGMQAMQWDYIAEDSYGSGMMRDADPRYAIDNTRIFNPPEIEQMRLSEGWVVSPGTYSDLEPTELVPTSPNINKNILEQYDDSKRSFQRYKEDFESKEKSLFKHLIDSYRKFAYDQLKRGELSKLTKKERRLVKQKIRALFKIPITINVMENTADNIAEKMQQWYTDIVIGLMDQALHESFQHNLKQEVIDTTLVDLFRIPLKGGDIIL